jgi:hypothetical protein
MFESNPLRRRVLALAAAAFCAAGMLAAAPSANAALGSSPMTTPQGASVTTSGPSAMSGVPSASATATMRNAITPGASAAASSVASAASGSAAASGPAAYTVRSTTLATGTVVREYVDGNGQVFAACWNGPAYPNLTEIFGNDYYQQYVEGARAARAARGAARGPATVEQGGLVVRAGGHMGHYVGCGYLPALMPPGVTGDVIR